MASRSDVGFFSSFFSWFFCLLYRSVDNVGLAFEKKFLSYMTDITVLLLLSLGSLGCPKRTFVPCLLTAGIWFLSDAKKKTVNIRIRIILVLSFRLRLAYVRVVQNSQIYLRKDRDTTRISVSNPLGTLSDRKKNRHARKVKAKVFREFSSAKIYQF